MSNKLRQIIDNIHGTIYLTELEGKIISTPFFTRLHDVNQNSINYLIFPPGRTKRFEHSLGTMQLTSDIFYNAAVNSCDEEALKLLITSANKDFIKTIQYIRNIRNKNVLASRLGNEPMMTIDKICEKYDHEGIKVIIEKNLSKAFGDCCLLNLAPSCLGAYDLFIFICLMQALRIAGLLHDCGHPPQSHIIEDVLSEISDQIDKVDKARRTSRQKSFKSIIDVYRKAEIQEIDSKMAIKARKPGKKALHEMIGIIVTKHIGKILDYGFLCELRKEIGKEIGQAIRNYGKKRVESFLDELHIIDYK